MAPLTFWTYSFDLKDMIPPTFLDIIFRTCQNHIFFYDLFFRPHFNPLGFSLILFPLFPRPVLRSVPDPVRSTTHSRLQPRPLPRRMTLWWFKPSLSRLARGKRPPHPYRGGARLQRLSLLPRDSLWCVCALKNMRTVGPKTRPATAIVEVKSWTLLVMCLCAGTMFSRPFISVFDDFSLRRCTRSFISEIETALTPDARRVCPPGISATPWRDLGMIRLWIGIRSTVALTPM